MTIRIMLLDDEDMVRNGIRQALDDDPDVEVVAEARSATEAIALGRRLRPAVILSEVQLGRSDGFKLAKALLEQTEEWAPKIIILTSWDLDEHLVRMIRMGLSGFLLKNLRCEELIHSVKAVASGGAVISPEMTRRIIDRFEVALPPVKGSYPGALSDLSERELDVLKAVGRGLSNREIARELHLTSATIKTHVSNMLTKLGLRDRVQAALLAHQLRLLSPTIQLHTANNGDGRERDKISALGP